MNIKERSRKSLFYMICITGIFILHNPSAYSDSHEWLVNSELFSTVSGYQSSDTRDGFVNAGIHVDAKYLDSAGFGVGYTYAQVIGVTDKFDITENAFFVSGNYNYHTDSLSGKLGFRADYYGIEDSNSYTTRTIVPGAGGMGGSSTVTSAFEFTNIIDVVFAQLSYINFKKTFYMDVGYAFSNYDLGDVEVQDIDIDQWTPTLGFGWNEKYDWLQARLYIIDLSNGDSTGGVTSYESVDLTWTHWFKPGMVLNMDSFTAGLLVGEREFALDPDARIVYSIGHTQIGTASINAVWKINESSRIMTYYGYSRYDDQENMNEYASNDFYINFSKDW